MASNPPLKAKFLTSASLAEGIAQAAEPAAPVVHPGSSGMGWNYPSGYRRASAGSSDHSTISGRWLIQLAYVLIDLGLVCANGVMVFVYYYWPTDNAHPFKYFWNGRRIGLPELHYTAFLLLYSVLILLFCNWQRLYQTPGNRTAVEEATRVLKAVLLATLLLTAFIYLSGFKQVSRLVVGIASVLCAITLILWRYWKRRVVLRRRECGIGVHNAIIIGAGKVGQALARELEENKHLGYRLAGFLDSNHQTHPRMLGKIEDLPRVARSEFIEEVFVTVPSERELVKAVAALARPIHLNVKVVLELYDGLAWAAPIQNIGEFPVIALHQEPIPLFGLFLKRFTDLVGSAIGLCSLSPLLILTAAVIKFESRGPAIFSSYRIGKKGRKFLCYKFRTMVRDAEQQKESLRNLNERDGPFFKISNDPRLTRIGGFLRKYSIDELPQLWNVLKGDMSLVGPRPHPLDDFKKYELEHRSRLDVTPGLTCLWQIEARNDPSFETNLAMDGKYIENWSYLLDLKILLRTVPVLFKGTGL